MKNLARLSFIAVMAAALIGAGCNKRDDAGAPPAAGGGAAPATPMSSASAASQ